MERVQYSLRHSINDWIFSRTEIFRRKSESAIRLVYLCNKSRFKKCNSCWYIKILKNDCKTNLKSNVHKLYLDKLQNEPTNLSNVKSKVDKLDVDKLVPVPVHLSKLVDVVKGDNVKKDVYNAKIKNIEGKIPDITNTATNLLLLLLETKYLMLVI